MAYKASGASYASTLASIYYTFGNSRHKGSSSGRRGDTGMHGDPRLTTNDVEGWQLPATRSTTLGTADVPTVSSTGRGDQLHQVAQSAELPEARVGRPTRRAAERPGCGIPPDGKGVNIWISIVIHGYPRIFNYSWISMG